MKQQLLTTSIVFYLLLTSVFNVQAKSQSESKMQLLIAEIIKDTKTTSRETGIDTLSPKVLEAMQSVKRYQFVDQPYLRYSYENRPLPIGEGQTISQPFIVAIMTELLQLKGEEVVLEVGTGSGYQAAILSRLSKKVHTIEIIESLAEKAKLRLKNLGFENISVYHGDGYRGLEKLAPFDAIIVTAAPAHIPEPLIDQLKAGGRMVIPVGEQDQIQFLTLVTKDKQGKVKKKQVLPVSFVPLTRD
ncbi:protein-L-isoaspartate(D-aspartate) O-methyltransferase [Aliikangiella sp. G2MR2-5]|uniref:protein-L-isoaspartate(D-aspartate) O-methyltransferase n=1 Tax=Aliikangiella sp. G2MR2-5 TaxID=2788943 RepID=UPI001FED4725|nr:protein-L-isoaspartate(D-aspartate) O-methyltransferase [Aliikangiella sp. G2MR2-5]